MFAAQSLARGQVEGGEWFIQQQQLGLARDGAREGHALLLSAGKFSRPARRQAIQAEPPQHFLHPRVLLRGAHAVQAVGDVAGHGQMREQRIVLGHKSEPATLRGHHIFPAGKPGLISADNLPGIGYFQSGEAAEQGGFAGSRWAEQHGHPNPGNFQRFGADDRAGPKLLGKIRTQEGFHGRLRWHLSPNQSAAKAMPLEIPANVHARVSSPDNTNE